MALQNVDSTRDDDEPDDLSKDTAYFLLKNQRRRAVIEYLLEENGSAGFDDLVMGIAAEEKDKPIGEITYKERKSVHTALYQSHLPKLQEAGVVEYDRRSGSVSLTDRIDAVRPYLDVDDQREEQTDDGPWQTAFLGFLAILGVLALSQWTGLYPGTPSSLVLLLIVIGTGLAVATHRFEQSRK